MRTRTLAVTLAVCIPAALFAQRGGRGSSDPSPLSSASGSPPGGAKSPSSRDLAKLIGSRRP